MTAKNRGRDSGFCILVKESACKLVEEYNLIVFVYHYCSNIEMVEGIERKVVGH
jgi:hypothetical protein